jgi:hypothetical protein
MCCTASWDPLADLMHSEGEKSNLGCCSRALGWDGRAGVPLPSAPELRTNHFSGKQSDAHHDPRDLKLRPSTPERAWPEMWQARTHLVGFFCAMKPVFKGSHLGCGKHGVRRLHGAAGIWPDRKRAAWCWPHRPTVAMSPWKARPTTAR